MCSQNVLIKVTKSDLITAVNTHKLKEVQEDRLKECSLAQLL